jgi:hypothetical protein
MRHLVRGTWTRFACNTSAVNAIPSHAVDDTSASTFQQQKIRRLAIKERAAHAPGLWVAAILGWWAD